MDSAEELQQLEITALRSIYDKDFILCPPPTVWKVASQFNFSLHKYWLFMEGAARLHEFIIKVYHPDPEHASKISLHLHVKWATLFFKNLSARSESES